MPEEFQHLYPMMGMFHFGKVALHCTDRYITGSGLDDDLIETEVFGFKTVKRVFNGSHYTRSLQGLLILSDTIQALKLKAFWAINSYDDYCGIAESVLELREALKCKNDKKCQELFNSLLHSETYNKLRIATDVFDADQYEKSELCKYFSVFIHMVSLVKNLATADREGNWKLHVETASQLERIKKLEVDNPFLYQRFIEGHFVVGYKEGKFNSVAPDMKLEQDIQRSKKSSKGIVGQARKSHYIAEWELIYHEILSQLSYKTQPKFAPFTNCMSSLIATSTNLSRWVKDCDGQTTLGLLLSSIHTDTRISVQMSKFWASCGSKTKLQELARNLSDHSNDVKMPIIASGVVIDVQIITPYLNVNNDKCEIKKLSSIIKEADRRIIRHANWAILDGTKWLVILSNDTDVVAVLLKIGTKQAAIKSDPTTYQEQFGKTDNLSQEDVLKVGKYLLKVWSRNTAVE
ncbi:hypothetical protein PR048_028455 [Dryococelus australis]|uniref:Uncharacterized protein n=1 Tax=Dryococelus australis TaxID=614101 RepID=A0ABQ9GAL0_9NEOP|nr:hypothetical protein PR048_028455 [Dryococelus australis]